jgi:leucyl aminopeptidase (aminopeptidase T)
MRIPSRTMLVAVGLALACTPDRRADDPPPAASTSSAGASVAADTAELGRLARQVTERGLRIRKGDVVMISGGAHTIPVMEALALETARVGGHFNLQLQSQRLLRAILTEIPDEYVGLPPTFFADWLRSTTVYIGLPDLPDPEAAFAGVPEDRLAKWNLGFAAIHDMLNGSPVRGAYIEYPSPGRAAAVGMEPDAFARMMLAAIGADPEAMARTGHALEERIRNARSVRITSPAGTDLRLELGGRAGILDAGMLSPGAEKEKLFAKRWFVLPGGNFGVAPRETSATGTVVTPKDRCNYRPVRDARYRFSAGRVTEVTAAEGESCIKGQLDSYGEGIRRIGFLGIGLNPELRVVEQDGDYRPYNAAGMVYVVVGDNRLQGGTNEVEGGMSFGLPVVGATVEVDGQVLVRDGKLALGDVATAGPQGR